MPIRYKANDPASTMPDRTIAKSRAQSGGGIGIALPKAPAEMVYAENDANFTYWQAREAALRALSVWKQIASPLGRWQNGMRQLPLNPNAGVGLQASYDRKSLSFHRWENPSLFFVASSADAVIHEVGHALLDAIRPDLWQSPYPEIVSFHEAFADCLCLFVSLLDSEQQQHLLSNQANPLSALDSSNDVSRIAESIALTYGQSFSPSDPSAVPRDANNTFKWTFSHMLPSIVSGGTLSNEPHSFSRIMTGCIYDCVRHIYSTKPPGEAGLTLAVHSTAELFIEATRNAPEGVEFFRKVGQSMVLADRTQNNGAHQHAIAKAFAGHDISLGSSALITPTIALAGSAPANGTVGLMPQARQDLNRRLQTQTSSPFRYRKIRLGGQRLIDARYFRDLDLGKFHRQLKNVSVRLSDSILFDVKQSMHRVMDALPDQISCEEHAAAFAKTLMDNHMLVVNRKFLTRSKSANHPSPLKPLPVFAIRKRKGKAYLTRVRCACHARQAH